MPMGHLLRGMRTELRHESFSEGEKLLQTGNSNSVQQRKQCIWWVRSRFEGIVYSHRSMNKILRKPPYLEFSISYITPHQKLNCLLRCAHVGAHGKATHVPCTCDGVAMCADGCHPLRAFPCALYLAHGKQNLCHVPDGRHTAKLAGATCAICHVLPRPHSSSDIVSMDNHCPAG